MHVLDRVNQVQGITTAQMQRWYPAPAVNLRP